MSEGGLTILAVDDERTQLEDLARLLRSSRVVTDVECAYDGHDALVKASGNRYDAIFLDVRMPDLDGLELGRVLRRFKAPPQLVFVSAYDTAAADAFELHALDYLRKPVSRGRLQEALDRVVAAVEAGVAPADSPAESAPPELGVLAVTNSRTGATRLLPRSAVLYLQAHGDFVRVVTADGRYLIRATLSELERRLEPAGFLRVHRQYVANLNNAREVRPQLGGTAELVFAQGHSIPIARRHVADLRRRLGV
jgi:DNA-binding LytR/AlgR family response regulator